MADISYEPTALSIISAYSSISDVDIVKKYKETKDSLYYMVMLTRYEWLLVDLVSSWRTIVRDVIFTNDDDFQDMIQIAYFAMFKCFSNMKNPDIVRSMSFWLRGYVFRELNTKYKYRKREYPTDETPDIPVQAEQGKDFIDIQGIYEKLKGKDAKLFKMIYIDLLSNVEIEKVMFSRYQGKRRNFMAWRAREFMYKKVRKMLRITRLDMVRLPGKLKNKGVQWGC